MSAQAPWVRAGLLIALVLILLLSGLPTTPLGSPAKPVGSSDAAPSAAVVPATGPAPSTPVGTGLTVAPSSVNLSGQFLGTTINNEVRMFRGETNAVNATPAHVLVWPGAMAGEDYDPFTETHYNTYYGTPTPALTTESEFVAMCKAIHCTAIMQVPAEIDNPAVAAEIVNYTEVNLSFIPAYWMIGNEPELWEHWKVPWKSWGSQYTTGPTPTQFGDEVVAYVDAIRAIDNSTPILGLPASGCTCGYWTFAQWISGVLAVTGSKIQAVAFHEYPAGWLGTGNGSLQAFYQTIQSAAGIPIRIVQARAAVQSACPGCNVSVFVSELGSALSWSTYGPYAIGFSGSLSLAAQITQAMDVNLTNIDLFAAELTTTNSWFNNTGVPRTDYTFYTQVLDHLGPQSFAVNLTGLGHSLYGIDTIAPNDAGRRDLLVVNTNISKSIAFTPRFAESAGTEAVEAWYWNGSIHYSASNQTGWVEPYTLTPTGIAYPGGLPTNFTLPPQSMVLFETYPANGTYVHLNENGVPAGTPWYATLGNHLYTTTESNLSLLLAPGTYPIRSAAIPLPIGGHEYVPEEQLTPFAPSPAQIEGASTNVTVNFVTQWRVNVTASPAAGGTLSREVTWWNESQPLNVSATPTLGYAFVGWSGWGPGSYNGTNRSITIVPGGRITEKARFVLGEQVILWEAGLPTGTPWSVIVRGFTTSSNTTFLNVYEPYGTYGFNVPPISGYRALPKNGGFNVTASVQIVKVAFVPITPPPPAFVVTFEVTGVPSSLPVSITVRGATQITGGNGDPYTPEFHLINGSYAYRLGYVPGYHAETPLKEFSVLGGPLTVVVPYVPTVYPVTWQANGTRVGLNWSVLLNGELTSATSAWVSSALTNGSYPYTIFLPPNFTVDQRSGIVSVNGSSVQLPIQFSLLEFPMRFEGAGAGGAWSVRLGNLTEAATSSGPSFMAANGSYTFDIHPPAGFYAVPSHGNITVAGPGAYVVIQFHPVSEQPSAALVAALTSGAVEASIWIGVSIFVGFATFRRLRRRGG